MKLRKNIFLLLLFTASFTYAQTIQERLGYPEDTKLLILHADDIGMSHSQNRATIIAFEEEMIISGSVMVPCPWFLEIAEWAKKNPQSDLGLHLTLTSEWIDYKWGPVSPSEKVPSLVDKHGFFHSGRDSLARTASLEDVETELRAQIERSISLGMDPTHLDPHMFLLFQRPDFFKILVNLGREYEIPVLYNRQMLTNSFGFDPEELTGKYEVLVDSIYGAGPEDFKAGLAKYYKDVLTSLKPGLNYLFVHTAYDDEEMKAITRGYEDWGSKWRQEDLDFFTSNECRNIIKNEKIRLITWREIRDKLIRDNN